MSKPTKRVEIHQDLWVLLAIVAAVLVVGLLFWLMLELFAAVVIIGAAVIAIVIAAGKWQSLKDKIKR